MLEVAALVTAALFSGAAIYVPFAEHHARRGLDPRAQLQHWKPSYTRGAIMQASLALVSGLLGIAVWLIGTPSASDLWLIGGVLMLAAITYTFAVIWGLNGRLKATPLDQASADTVAMLERWGQLHLGRMALGIAGMLTYAVAIERLLGFTLT
jgi:hypothetical protein